MLDALTDFAHRVQPLAEAAWQILWPALFAGGMIGLVYGLIVGFTGDEEEPFRRRYFRDDKRD